MAIGRPSKHYKTSWGETIVGLYKCPDGRWRVMETGQKFTEPDERRAVAKFRSLQPEERIHVPGRLEITHSENPNSSAMFFKAVTPSTEFWPWLREMLITKPEYVAKMVSMPELANLRHLPIPKAPIKLTKIVETYEERADSNWRTKGQVKSAFKRLMEFTKADTLNDLTTEQLVAFRRHVLDSGIAPAAAGQVFAKIKSAISFAAKQGMDATQLNAVAGRLKVLYAPPSTSTAKPQPISKSDFHKLLKGTDAVWRAILLTSLNMALYLEDICELRWEDFDLEAGTYVGKRAKTSVVRVGWLWPETVAALKAIPRKGQSPLVLTSTTGIRYPASTRYSVYKVLKEKVGVLAPFSSIRDGGYSAAAAACDEKTAKVFAAHRFGGLMDSYVQRRPEIVKPAADAVYACFGPFQLPSV